MRNEAVSRYFEIELDKLGYGDCKVGWSLGYVQGDGMAFWGRPDIEQVARRLMKGPKLAAITRTINESSNPTVEIVNTSRRYAHTNTMQVWFQDPYSGSIYDPGDDMTEFQRQAWIDFRESIAEDVKAVSRRLQQEGYQLLQAASPLWWYKGESIHQDDTDYLIRRRTEGALRIDWWVRADDDYTPYHPYDDAEAHSVAQSMVAGERVSCYAEVKIYDAASGQELADAGCLTTDTPDIHYIITDLLPEIESEAMDDVQELAKRLCAIA